MKTFRCSKCGYESRQPMATAMFHKCTRISRLRQLELITDELRAIRMELEALNEDMTSQIKANTAAADASQAQLEKVTK